MEIEFRPGLQHRGLLSDERAAIEMKNNGCVGPVLFARGADDDECRLSAIVITASANSPLALRPMGRATADPLRLCTIGEQTVWRYDFSLPAQSGAFYRFGDVDHEVAANLTGDIRIAYVSCNGQEDEPADLTRNQRNQMWRRLADEHDQAAFHLMLHGGDQLYADQVLQAHPTLAAWAQSKPEEKAKHRFTDDVRSAAERYLFDRYTRLYAQTEIAHLARQVPSIMMWDDHDIIDGWGSLPEATLDSPVGQGLFEVSRRMFLLFQMGATREHQALDRIRCTDANLTLSVIFPGLEVIAPDLRSERRPDRVMGESGWSTLTRTLKRPNAARRRLLLSSVPLLGPRLSWIESLIGVVPKIRKYEDDLRDQWQSRAHRAEWRRCLELLERALSQGGGDITIISGEIHLATRAEMRTENGTLQQLVASGIVHPPPPGMYARVLGWLAALGEDPLPGKPIKLKPLPGHKRPYVAERNYLVVERRQDGWSAAWELEDSGRTLPLAI